MEKLPQPFETIKTFIRRIHIRLNSRQDEEKVPIRVRYKCKRIGHIKAECKTLKYQKCFILGNADPLCQQRRSYAAAVSETSTDNLPTKLSELQNMMLILV